MVSEAMRAALARPESALDLVEGALAIARLEYPDLAPEGVAAELDRLAVLVRARIAPETTLRERLAALVLVLFREAEFRGDEEGYYDPRNSCLNAVLERRRGIPITLSLVAMEVGRRAGVELHGVSFPGHFLVSAGQAGERYVLDPFNGGQSLGARKLRERLVTALGPRRGAEADLAAILVPATRGEMLARMLRNLKMIYSEAGRLEQAIDACTLILAVQPAAVVELRDRGQLYRQLEAYRAAHADFAAYLERLPQAPDWAAIQTLASELARLTARMN